MSALILNEIHSYYGISHILHGISLEVREKEVVCLLGRNGAGKTTTIRSIIGLTPPRSGKVVIFGSEVQGKKPYEIFRRGVRLIPQGRHVFPMLTVEENLRLALVQAGIPDARIELEKAYGMFPILKEKCEDRARTLFGGQLQMVANARALLGPSQLILMDEPTEGLAPIIIEQIGKSILEIKQSGRTVLLAEQHLQMALNVGDRHYIIDNGHLVFQGTSADIRANEEIKTTYLGVSKDRITPKGRRNG
ncbi:MAG TPA: ABC transporter ATP-binding protein [Thermodesulfobacteriota bacterium]|nr:ABC transporter ATP-binding protein [Thermodesulfobacteriota bacterium]